MDLSLSIAIGSSVQVALFVAPILVLVSLFLGPVPMDLAFPAGLVLTVLLAVLITAQVPAMAVPIGSKAPNCLPSTPYWLLRSSLAFLEANDPAKRHSPRNPRLRFHRRSISSRDLLAGPQADRRALHIERRPVAHSSATRRRRKRWASSPSSPPCRAKHGVHIAVPGACRRVAAERLEECRNVAAAPGGRGARAEIQRPVLIELGIFLDLIERRGLEQLLGQRPLKLRGVVLRHVTDLAVLRDRALPPRLLDRGEVFVERSARPSASSLWTLSTCTPTTAPAGAILSAFCTRPTRSAIRMSRTSLSSRSRLRSLSPQRSPVLRRIRIPVAVVADVAVAADVVEDQVDRRGAGVSWHRAPA